MSFLTGGGKATFERLLDSATSQMLLEPSWVTNLELCDCIRQQDVTPKFALVALQKRMRDPNPHVSKFALIVLETCVKNCGAPFHEEMANNEFMDDLRTLVQTGSAPVKEQVLTMLQAWNHAFRNKTQFQPILATYNLMRMEGHKFPPLNESDAMFSADAAPSWKDGDVCHLCRVKFGTFTRQHHCRACGECFCSKCSSKSSIIPKMGIEREVRVCDTCFDELNPNAGKEQARKVEVGDNDLPAEYLNSDLAKEQQTKPTLSEDDVKAQEEEELQLAMAISLSEEESKLGPKKNWSMPAAPVSETIKPPEPKAPEPKSTLFSGVAASLQSVAEDSAAADLNKYLDRNYWEKKNAELKSREQPSAPAAALPPVSQPPPVVNYSSDEGSDENVESSAGAEVFINTMSKSIEMFTDRMNNVRSKGKHIAMDTTVQSLFQSLSAMHPQLMKLIEDEEESKVKYDAMLQKLAVIREARESLNDMRTQYTEKFQQQELEQEMLRRMQMEQKLELMRQQKQEYLEYQRQLQIQRQQELEHFQLEKLRQKQMFGINGAPVIPDYPEVPTHAPGSIVLPGSYKPQPQAVHYGAEMALQNPKIAVAAAVRVPQAESLPAESYHGMDRPPQYPGSPRHFVRPEAQELPPSYATATEGGVTSNPEYYSHNGEPIASSQWQQQTLPPVRPATHPNQPFQQQSPHGSLTHIQQDGGQQPGQQQQSFNQQQPGQQMPPQISQPQAHPIQQQQQQQHQHPGLPPQTSIPQHMPPATSIQQHHHQQQPQQFHQQAGGGPPPPPIHSSQSQQQMPPQQQQQPPPQMQQPQMGHQQPQPQQSHSQQLPPQQMPPPPAHQQMQPPPQQQMQQTSQQQGGQPMQQPQQQMQPQQQQSQQKMQPQYQQQQQQQQQQPGQMQYYDQSMQQQQPSMSQPNEPQQQYGMNQQQQQQPLPQQQMYQQQPQQQPQQFAQLPPQQQQHQQQQQQVDNLSSNMKDLQLISFD